MEIKMTFLGAGSAFTVGDGNFHSNVLFQSGEDSLLLDAGSDIRMSLYEMQLSYLDIKNIYISHLHSDHIGGLEYMSLSTYFDPRYKGRPNLFASEKIIEDLWVHSLSGGLRTIQTKLASLETFYNVYALKRHETFEWASIQFKLVQMVHVISEYELMPCYGLIFNINNTRIFFTTDTQYAPAQLFDYYREADIIFHDCETSPSKSGVHAHYTDLLQIPADLKKKIWLYHYNPGPLPDAKADGFLGFVKKGQTFTF